MLISYSGLPGSGKTAHAARDIRYALSGKHPRPVIANFMLAADAKIPTKNRRFFYFLDNDQMRVENIMAIVREYWRSPDCPYDHIKEDWILLIIDEAQISHNSRTWTQGDRMSMLTFFSQSRHYGVKCVLIAQKVTMIDKQYRDLIDIDYIHKRLSRLSILMKPVQWLVGGCLTLVVGKYQQENERSGVELMRFGKRDFQMYDSYNSIAIDSI